MIAKTYEKGDLRMYMVRAGTNNYYIVYINGDRTQLIHNKMDVDTANEMFDFLIDKDSQKEDTNEDNELFSRDEFEKLLKDLEDEE